MSLNIKKAILKSIAESVSKGSLKRLEHIGSRLTLAADSKSDKVQWKLLLHNPQNEEHVGDLEEIRKNEGKIIEAAIAEKVKFSKIEQSHNSLHFDVDKEDFIRDVLSSNPTELSFQPEKKKYIVEFSSPNVAKEFHIGHLRSTIIGNFLSNYMTKMGKDVVRMNYLGDWGTQLGLICVGVELLGYNEEALKENAILKLQTAYVHANKLKDETILNRAREVFQKLENGDEEQLKMWKLLQDWTRKDLIKIYDRLGIKFDEYEWESMYNKKQANEFIQKLESLGIARDNEDGQKVADFNEKEACLLKSDGSTLYLTRDLVAAFARRTRHKFDKMFYVVERGQSEHFQKLFHIAGQVDPDLVKDLKHVQFGKIAKMSTRKGTAISLKDVLDEAQERMYEKQLSTATTKGGANKETADILGASAIIVNDLKRRREKNYDFDWETALRATGDSGVQLQYAHCRLNSLYTHSGATLPEECDPEVFVEKEAIDLITCIARYEETLLKMSENLEAFILIQYLVELTSTISKAFTRVRVKGAESHLASQRLLLFHTARLVLEDGLKILGIRCLKEM